MLDNPYQDIYVYMHATHIYEGESGKEETNETVKSIKQVLYSKLVNSITLHQQQAILVEKRRSERKCGAS